MDRARGRGRGQAGQAAHQHVAAGLLQCGAAQERLGLAAPLPGPVAAPDLPVAYDTAIEEEAMMKPLYLFAVVSAVLFVGVAGAQHPLLDMAANKVIQKYQQSTCEQLWEQKGKPKTAQ